MPDSEMQSTETTLRGAVMVLLQYDVAEAIRLDLLQELVSARKVAKPSMKHPAPGYVRYQRPPVVVPVESLVLESGEQLHGEIKYYDYGVVSVVFELPFSGGWDKLTALASRWVWDVDFAAQATAIVRASLERATAALIKPYEEWLSEDYLIFHVREIDGSPSVAELIREHGPRIAQVVRGDTGQLAESECNEVLQSRISYYANDLAVIGWNAAFLYDSTSGAETAVQLLEYANSQLLEFRHYDDLLTEELERVYTLLDKGTRHPGALAAGALGYPAAHRAAGRGRADRTRRQRHQVPQRHVRRAPLQAGRAQGGRARLQGAGHPQGAYRRGTLPLHGGPVQPEPRLLHGTDGGDYPGGRAGVPVPGECVLGRINDFVAPASRPAVTWASWPTPNTAYSVTVCANGIYERATLWRRGRRQHSRPGGRRYRATIWR